MSKIVDLRRFTLTVLLGASLAVLGLAGAFRYMAGQELQSLGVRQHAILSRALRAALNPVLQESIRKLSGLAREELLAHPETARLRQLVGAPLAGTGVVRVKVFASDGTVLFSTDSELTGVDQSDNESFRSALGGEVTGQIIHQDTFNTSDRVLVDRDIAETYVPLPPIGPGDPGGVLEVYSDVTDIVKQINQTHVRIALVATVVFLSFVFGMLIVYRIASRALAEEQATAAGYLSELEHARDDLERRVQARTVELSRSEQRFRDVAEAAGEYIWETDADGRYTFLTHRATEIFGYSNEELMGRRPTELMYPADVESVRERLGTRSRDCPFRDLEHRTVTGDGRIIWQRVSGLPILDEEGRRVGFRGTAEEITERKQAEQELRILSQAVQQSPSAILITNPEGVIEFVNQRFEVVTGYSAEESIGETPRILTSGQMPAGTYQELWSTIKSGRTWHGELLNRRKSGKLYWDYTSISPVLDEEGEIQSFVSVQTDITERKKQESALRDSENHLRTVMDSVVDAVLSIRPDGTIESANRAVESMFGHPVEELLGGNVGVLMPEPYRSAHARYVERYIETGEARIIGVGARRVEGLRADGTTFPLELSVGEMTAGSERRFVGVLRDLSERERAARDLELARQRYYHREKMAAIGQLAAGIIHEVNNPLSAIKGSIEALGEAVDRSSQGSQNSMSQSALQLIDIVDQHVNRLAETTQQISEMAAPQTEQRELLSVNEVVRSACNLLRYDRRWKNIELDMCLDGSVPAVEASAGQLRQTVLNLLINAADALEGIDTPRVRLETSFDGERVRLVVRDNGPGMNEEAKTRAFEAFFTTKASGLGMGLGLAYCKTVAAAHGGDVTIESEPGAGATVSLVLPLESSEFGS